MKRRLWSIILSLSMTLTMTPVFAAEPGEIQKSGEPIMAYVPLDNRTVNVDRVVYEAESAGFTVRMPDEDLYATRLDGQPKNSNKTQYGDSERLLKWILEMDQYTDYFVISLDQLLSGGLVNSRTLSSRGISKEQKMIDAIVELSQSNQVYIIDTVARLATCTVGYQGATLETYNYLRDYSIKPRPELSGMGLNIDHIVRYYPRDEQFKQFLVGSSYVKLVGNMLRTRERKLKLIDYILSQEKAGEIKYFIGIDDSSSQNTIQTNEIKYIRQKMGGRGLIYSGTDELGMMAVLSMMIDYYHYSVNASVVYFGETEGSGSGSQYDLETVKDNVNKHLDSIGVKLVDSENADLEIVVLTSPSKNILNAKYINKMIDYINGNISKGKPTIVINSAPSAYSGNLEYRMIRECEMSMLLSYSSWGTVGNSIGLALGNGISRYLYLHSREDSSDKANIAFLRGLIFSFEKDISYLRGGGKQLFDKYLTEKGWSASNFYQDDKQVKMVNVDLENILKTSEYNVTVNDIIDNLTNCRYLKGLDGESGIIGEIRLSNYSAPFYRTFEIRFDIDVELNKTTINGFGDTMTVTIPYAPAEGQLTYSLKIYSMDAVGKLRKVPSKYDKAAGTVSFTASSLSDFFIDAKNMNAEKAYSLFKDVPKDSWFFDDVIYVRHQGIMKGTADGVFEPNAVMSSAMLANLFANMAGTALPQDFLGRSATTDPVTREQLADALWRYAKYKNMDTGRGSYPGVSNYADAFAVSEEMRDGLDWACSNGIIKGTGNGTLIKPQSIATRAEVAAVLKRFAEL